MYLSERKEKKKKEFSFSGGECTTRNGKERNRGSHFTYNERGRGEEGGGREGK